MSPSISCEKVDLELGPPGARQARDRPGAGLPEEAPNDEEQEEDEPPEVGAGVVLLGRTGELRGSNTGPAAPNTLTVRPHRRIRVGTRGRHRPGGSTRPLRSATVGGRPTRRTSVRHLRRGHARLRRRALLHTGAPLTSTRPIPSLRLSTGEAPIARRRGGLLRLPRSSAPHGAQLLLRPGAQRSRRIRLRPAVRTLPIVARGFARLRPMVGGPGRLIRLIEYRDVEQR